MLITQKKIASNDIFPNLKNSFVRIKKQDYVATKIVILVIELFLVPLRIVQDTYYHLVYRHIVIKKTPLRNKYYNVFFATIIFAIAAAADKYSPSNVTKLTNPKSLFSKVFEKNPIFIASACLSASAFLFLLYSKSKKTNRPSKLPCSGEVTLHDDLLGRIYEFSDNKTESALNVATQTAKAKVELKKNNSAKSKIDQIENSEDCKKALAPILNNESLSYAKKWQLIKSQLRAEIKSFGLDLRIESPESIIDFVENARKDLIGNAQIHFADQLLNYLKDSAPQEDVIIKINSIKDRDIRPLKKAEEIDQAITKWLNTKDENGNFVNPLKTSYINLNLINQGLKSIIPCISQFKNLRSLNLDDNQLTSLPESLANLTKLTNISINNNLITHLPNFTQLVFLKASNNQITELPESFKDSRDLEHLDLSYNLLETIPNYFSYLWELQYLYLNNNQITSVPYSIFTMNRNINRSEITGVRRVPTFTVPYQSIVANFNKMAELNLSNNRIVNVTDSTALDLNRAIRRVTALSIANLLGYIGEYFEEETLVAFFERHKNSLFAFIPNALENLGEFVTNEIDLSSY